MIGDLNKLGIVLKSLDVIKIGTVGVNVANVETYRTALKGLSIEQSVFALASKGATEEQIRQILIINEATAKDVEAAIAKAGLTTATKALTQAEMLEIATKNGVAKAEAEELLKKIGITATEEGQVAVKKQVTLAMLEQAVASGNLTAAESTQIATMLGLNAIETTNIGITNVLTASFAKLWAVITAHPTGAILTAIGAVAVGTIAYINKTNKDAKKALVEAHETAQQALEDTKTSLSDDKSELQSVNSELETTKRKIQEISSIGAPTLVEQNELSKLSTSNAQLEIQRTLLENNIKLKQKSAALDAKELLGTQVEMEYADILDNSSITSSKESYTYADHAKYQASNLKNAYNIYMKALEEGNVRRQELAQELIDASAGDTAELTSELLEIVESFKYDDGTIIEGYEELYNKYMGMIYNLQSLTNPGTFLDIAKSVTVGTDIDYEKAISEAYALAYDGNFDVAKLNQDFVKVLADAGIDESTIYYIFSLKQKEYQLLVDKINDKYKVSEVPDKVRQDYWDGNGNIHSEYVDVDEETKNRIEEINIINQYLNDYAKENPIEFQLITSYDEGFALLDKYIEEEKKKAENNTDYIGDYITNAIARIYDEAKVQSSTLNIENPNLSKQLLDSTESLDNFQSSVKSASDAYSTLLSGSYSSSELLDSIQAINQAVSSMGGSLNWEFIDSQSNSLEVLGNAIEYVSEQYADSILSGAGIDPDSDFGKILAENSIQAQKAATQLEAVNEQIDSLQEAYQNLTDAVDTYNQCGHITFDQLQNLLSMEPQYLACLTNENGQLQLNRQAMQNLADRRLYDAKVQAVQQAISELGTLTHHDEQKAITDSAQAFRDSVEDVSAYNMELAKTLTEAGIAAPLIRDLGAALNGAEERGASDVDIQTVINNLNAKMKLIGSVDIGNLSGASSSAAEQAETDWKNLLDKETVLLEKQLAANLITFQEYIDKRGQIIEDYYRDGKISAEEYYDALESMYDSQLSLYDKAANAVTNSIDDEIERLNEQKEAIENSHQVKIDAIQEEIDALNKANDARKAQIDLEKAQYEAERARNQRINKVYDGSQFVYAADVEAVRDAEENLADKKTQINISRLEAQIESLEREMENATKGLDSQIEALESYKEKWNEISGIYEEQQNKLIVAEILGADWESQVLNGRLDTLRSFTEQYIALQQAQADAAANAARIKAESAAGNAIGGNVGTAPTTQDLKQTDDGDEDDTNGQAPPKIRTTHPVPTTSGSVDYKHFNRNVTRIFATMAHFHGGLDEGYATAPGQSTPASRSLALLQKLAGENLLPNELPAILRHGELVITPEQQRNIIANTQRYCSLSSANSGYASSYSGEASQIHIDSLTISCPNVTNNSGAEYILKSLERLPLDNIQHSHRRRY